MIPIDFWVSSSKVKFTVTLKIKFLSDQYLEKASGVGFILFLIFTFNKHFDKENNCVDELFYS